ncbi:TetR/AcrR family transcriptional regulator [Sediminibacterium roseum]|uniref:TetR/AcrR family transcriptional regulator n=1 Tax=Sediminibacterium roseum TaxID=1978412 RepID=A0ABW9ZVD7_9BACT|nr:TetR family transcriptional regulator [Sediminibacterium roseum]NCI51106.1 TetR/AcrR family transcriptional regulator [Sediminibacterium roseum]
MTVDKKEHIMNVAIELFAEKGFEGTSVRDLAARADVNVAMVNYYFGSKDRLFEAIVEYKASFMRGKLDEIEADTKMSEIQKIDLIIENYVAKILSNPSFHRVLHQELLVSERESMHTNILKIFMRNIKTLRNIIEMGVKKKVFKKVDPELTMATLIGTINQTMLSKAMCNVLMEKDGSFDPYTDPHFRQRLIKHLKQVIHAYLVKE